jgi:2Fe-2S ferredoxin
MQPMSAAEDELLDLAEDRQPNSRLSCQIVMGSDLDGIVMQVPLLDR